jgi:hypothetical protein
MYNLKFIYTDVIDGTKIEENRIYNSYEELKADYKDIKKAPYFSKFTQWENGKKI